MPPWLAPRPSSPERQAGQRRLHAVGFYTYLVDVLQRISGHPAKRAIEPTPRMWRTLFADTPLRSVQGPYHHGPPSH